MANQEDFEIAIVAMLDVPRPVRTLAAAMLEEFGVCERTVQRALVRMEKLGELVRLGRDQYVEWARADSIYARNGYDPGADEWAMAAAWRAKQPRVKNRGRDVWKAMGTAMVAESRARRKCA